MLQDEGGRIKYGKYQTCSNNVQTRYVMYLPIIACVKSSLVELYRTDVAGFLK